MWRKISYQLISAISASSVVWAHAQHVCPFYMWRPTKYLKIALTSLLSLFVVRLNISSSFTLLSHNTIPKPFATLISLPWTDSRFSVVTLKDITRTASSTQMCRLAPWRTATYLTVVWSYFIKGPQVRSDSLSNPIWSLPFYSDLLLIHILCTLTGHKQDYPPLADDTWSFEPISKCLTAYISSCQGWPVFRTTELFWQSDYYIFIRKLICVYFKVFRKCRKVKSKEEYYLFLTIKR